MQSTKVPLTITWEEKMIFNGRSTDPQGRPAARAEFTKNVLAQMEDGRSCYCTKTMTTYTDQPIPLAELGKMRQSGAPAGAAANAGQGLPEVAEVAEAEPAKPKPDLTLIDCVGDALAISRKVDPDRPVLISLQRVTGDRLIYDRRTGDFLVPGPGMVYLYDRENNDGSSAGPRTRRAPWPPAARSGRPPARRAIASAQAGTRRRNTTRPATAREDQEGQDPPAGRPTCRPWS